MPLHSDELDIQLFEKQLARLLVAFASLQASQATETQIQAPAQAIAEFAVQVAGLVVLNFLPNALNAHSFNHYLSTSDHRNEKSNLNDTDVVGRAKLNILGFKQDLLSSSAFKRLCYDLGRLLGGLETLESIKANVQERLKASRGQMLHMHIEWEVPEFCKQEIERDGNLGDVISITGQAQAAWATQCCKYLQYLFPHVSSVVLKTIEGFHKRDFLGKSH